MEWQFLQRVAKCPDQAFALLEKEIADTFLPTLFNQTPPPREITSLPVKHAGIAVMNPEKTSPNNYQASTSATAEIVSGLRQTRPFLLQDHKNTVNAAREAYKERMFAEHKSSLDKALTNPTKTTPTWWWSWWWSWWWWWWWSWSWSW